MTDHSLLFTSDMIKGILEERKTQTRRLKLRGTWLAGDRIWARETWRAVEREADGVDGVLFRADDHFEPIASTEEAANAWIDAYDNGKHDQKWRPSIFMPKWAARIWLEVVAVEEQLLQDIPEADVYAEGVRLPIDRETKNLLLDISSKISPAHYLSAGNREVISDPTLQVDMLDWARAHYAALWDRINGVGSWASNPTVKKITFKRIEVPR